MIDDLKKLIRIESVSGNEKEITDFLEEEMRQHIPGELFRYQENLIWTCPEFDPKKQTILLVTHTDTVPFQPDDWKITPPLIPFEKDGKLYGRGSCDMKSGAAIMLDIMKRKLYGEQYNLLSVFYADEERGKHNGIREMIANNILPKADFAIVLEPSDAKVNYGVFGYFDFEIQTTGKAVHSSKAKEGENAIVKLFPIIEKIHNLPLETIDGTEESVSMNLIGGGNAINTVPDRAWARGNMRFNPSYSKEALLARFPDQTQYNYTLKEVSFYPGFVADTEYPLLKKLFNVAGRDGAFVASFWTDIDSLGHYGIPAVNFGPGDIRVAHTADEWVDIENMERVRDALIRFFTE